MIVQKYTGESAFDREECELHEFQVGEKGRFFFDYNGKDPSYISSSYAFNWTSIVCMANGDMPIAYRSVDCSKDWIHSNDMGNTALADVKIEEGYYIINVYNRKDSWEDRKPYDTVVIHRIVQMKTMPGYNRRDYVDITVETTHHFRSDEIPNDLGDLKKPVRFVLDRMIRNNVTNGCVPSYSRSFSREYTTKLFIREGDDLISYHKGKKLVLHHDSLEQEVYDGTNRHIKAAGKFIKVFIPKKELHRSEIVVDGYTLYMVTKNNIDLHRKSEQAKKLTGVGELVVIETTTGYRFIGIRDRSQNLFGLYHSWEGVSMVKLTKKEEEMIRRVEVFDLDACLAKQ